MLYFLSHLQRHFRPPSKILDGNFALDQAKIAVVASHGTGKRLITAALQEKEPITIYQLGSRFGIADILNQDQDTEFFISLLYYLGFLTLDKIDEFARLILKIPNLAVRKLIVEDL